MDDKERWDFHATIALCDQAIAPIRQIFSSLTTLLDKESIAMQDAGNDVALDKVLNMKHTVQGLASVEATLNKLKTDIEKYKSNDPK